MQEMTLLPCSSPFLGGSLSLALGLGRPRPEIYFGCLRDFLFVFYREVGLRFVSERHRRQIGWEGTHGYVIFLHRLDVPVARHRNAVFGAFQLCLQVAEVGIRL